MHELGRQLSEIGSGNRSLIEVFQSASRQFDGAYALAFAQRQRRDADCPRPVRHQAYVLCNRRTFVRCGKRKRCFAEPVVLSRVDQIVARQDMPLGYS